MRDDDSRPAGIVTHRARVVVSDPGRPCIENGMVVAAGDKILHVGEWDASQAEGGVTDHGEVILLPGLINSHCHLDYTVMRGAILERRSFSGWVRRINDLKRTLTDEDYLASIAAGFEELQRWGTTTVLNLESFPELMVRMPQPPIRTWWFYELLDIRQRVATDEVMAGAMAFFGERTHWGGGFGIAPHAPYTASLDLYRLSKECTTETGMLFTTHLAESEEEAAMFSRREGPLFEFLASIGRDMSDTGQRSPISHLLSADVLPNGSILVHMNHVTAADEAALAASNRTFHVVHCPNCHDYFDRPPFPFEVYEQLGINMSLATDSCASNSGLNLFSEMQTFRRHRPHVPPGQILRMVTANPAAALGKPHRLGTLRAGALAEIIAIPFNGSAVDAYEAVVENRMPPTRI